MDKAEFTQRVRMCERRLYRVSRTMLSSNQDCEDAVQEALLRAWSRLDSLRYDVYFETWLIRILINECRNLHRKRPVSETELPENLSVPECETSMLFDALMHLKEKHRITLELHYIEGYKTREVAQLLSIPESTVKWRLAQGRKELKRQLGEEA